MNEESCRFGAPPVGGSMLIWEITNLCNLECLHCCTNSSPSVATDQEVADDDVIKTIEGFPRVRVREVMFSGGEPFLRKNFIEFVDRSAKCGADVYIASNGTLISSDVAFALKRSSIKRIDISLDGDSPEVHRSLRLHASAFARTVSGISACVQNELPLRVSTMVTPSNYLRLDQMMSLLVDLGVRSVVVSSIQKSSGRAASNPQLQLERRHEDVVRDVMGSLTAKYQRAISIDCRLFKEYSSAPSGCPAGSRLLHISPLGDVSPCSWLYKIDKSRFTLGNIKEHSLEFCVTRSSEMLRPLIAQSTGCVIPYVHSI